jgi:hypothetical protein
MYENEEKEFSISLAEERRKKIYTIEYKGVEYIYITEYDDCFTDEELNRTDNIEITKKEEEEIMELISEIEDWDEVE